MAGYSGYSMSNNAVEAYANNEMPINKWKKSLILGRLYEIRDDLDFSVLTHEELKDAFLIVSSWHHTSMHFNKTDFYEVDEERVMGFTTEMVDGIITERQLRNKLKRQLRNKLSPEEKEKEKNEKELSRVIRKYMATCRKCGQNEYYCNNKNIKSGNVSIEELSEQIDKLNFYMADYERDPKGYKTIRGYVNNRVRGEDKNGNSK